MSEYLKFMVILGGLVISCFLLLNAACNVKKSVDIFEETEEPKGLGSFNPNPVMDMNLDTAGFGSFNYKGPNDQDLGGTSKYTNFQIVWSPGDGDIETVLDALINRLTHLQKTTSGSQANQNKLFELVNLKRKLKIPGTIKELRNE